MLNKYPRKEEIKVEKEKIALKENLVTKNYFKKYFIENKKPAIFNCFKRLFY